MWLIFQDNNVNVIHIESRRASGDSSSGSVCEFFSEIEIDNSNLSNLVTALKKEVDNFQLGDEEPHSPRLPTNNNKTIHGKSWNLKPITLSFITHEIIHEKSDY